MPRTATGQFAYHLRMAAVFAVAGELDESASETVLAWTMLAEGWPGADSAALATASELIGQDQVALSVQHRDAARDRARSLALDLEGHFVSVGRHAEAELYASLADNLDAIIATLVNQPA